MTPGFQHYESPGVSPPLFPTQGGRRVSPKTPPPKIPLKMFGQHVTYNFTLMASFWSS